ncbi:MAG: nitroreductase family protein [Candidatus Bathyarchaeales archaeon]
MLEAVKGRRSIRAFTDQPVSEDEVDALIDAACHAPSAGNIQPWEFIIVRRVEVKREIAVAALNQKFIEEAPVVIVVCADMTRSSRGYGSRGATLYCIQDTAAATQNILLTAHAMGLGTCWVGAFKEEGIKKALGIPENVRPVAIIPIGHSTAKPTRPPRRPLNDIVHYEKF